MRRAARVALRVCVNWEGRRTATQRKRGGRDLRRCCRGAVPDPSSLQTPQHAAAVQSMATKANSIGTLCHALGVRIHRPPPSREEKKTNQQRRSLGCCMCVCVRAEGGERRKRKEEQTPLGATRLGEARASLSRASEDEGKGPWPPLASWPMDTCANRSDLLPPSLAAACCGGWQAIDRSIVLGHQEETRCLESTWLALRFRNATDGLRSPAASLTAYPKRELASEGVHKSA